MDVFIIPRKDLKNEFIIYAPLQNIAFFGNQKAAEIVNKYQKGIELSKEERDSVVWAYLEKIEKTTVSLPETKSIGSEDCAVIILSQLCNLSCTYCYAQEARSKTVLSRDTIKSTIDSIVAKKPQKAEFVFIGGGEPFVTWKALKWAIDYIYETKHKETNISITITTNATLLDEEKIDFIKQHDIHLGISFDILPKIQNLQRIFPSSKLDSFEVVDAAIRKIEEAKIPYSFRSTISKLNVNLMPEMVRFVHVNYKSIYKLHFEPVMSIKDNDKLFYDNFIESFMEARRIGSKLGITVYNSISNSLDKINSRFCRGEFCVTPTGAIVACHRVSSENEPFFDALSYGFVEKEGTVSIDNNKVKDVFTTFTKKQEECSTCFAKWHCAGGCPVERITRTPDCQTFKCQFTKTILARLLEERLS